MITSIFSRCVNKRYLANKLAMSTHEVIILCVSVYSIEEGVVVQHKPS